MKVMCIGNSGGGHEYALNYQCNSLLLITNVVEYTFYTLSYLILSGVPICLIEFSNWNLARTLSSKGL